MSLKKQRLLLIVIAAFLSMVFLDQSGVGVILVSMQRDLDLTNGEAQWVMNAFLLTLSVLLLFCGRLSDHIGVRKVFVSGVVIFTLASLIIAIAPYGWVVILGRILQGIGGSLGFATYLVLLSRYIPAEKQGRSLGLCAAFGSLFLSSGPLIGGFLSQVLSWRWLFWVNLPVSIVCIYCTFASVPKDPTPHSKEKFDVSGFLIFVITLTALVAGIKIVDIRIKFLIRSPFIYFS